MVELTVDCGESVRLVQATVRLLIAERNMPGDRNPTGNPILKNLQGERTEIDMKVHTYGACRSMEHPWIDLCITRHAVS